MRSSTTNSLFVPATRLSAVGRRTFSVAFTFSKIFNKYGPRLIIFVLVLLLQTAGQVEDLKK